MSSEEPQVSSNVRERVGQRPILNSLLGALGEPLPPGAGGGTGPGVATQVLEGQLRASEERYREQVALHEKHRRAFRSVLRTHSRIY